MNAINPEMIVLAREIRGFTQKELAENINISQGMLSKIEKGLFNASQDFLLSIYDFLNFPISFFEQKDQLFDPNLTFIEKE